MKIDIKKEIVAYFTEDIDVKKDIFESMDQTDKRAIKYWKNKFIVDNLKLSFAVGSYLCDKIELTGKLKLFTPIYRKYKLIDINDIKEVLNMDKDQKITYILESSDNTFGKNWINKDWEVGLNGKKHPKSREIVLMVKDYTKERKNINKFLESDKIKSVKTDPLQEEVNKILKEYKKL